MISSGFPTVAADSARTLSLLLGIASVMAALIAIALAIFQTRQLKQQIERLADTEEALTKTQERINSLSSEMYEVLKLSEAAHSTPNLFDNIAQLAENCAVVYPQGSAYLTQFVAGQLETLVNHSSQARAGSIEITPSDIADMAVTLVQLAEEGDKIVTTSYVSTEDFWTRPSAQRYLEKTTDLIANRQVDITRIFLFDGPESVAPSLAEMDKQCRAGIHVRTAFTDSLEPALKRDMFLLGNRVAAEYILTTDRRDILTLRIWDAEHKEVGEVSDRMDRLVRSSTEYSPSDPIPTPPTDLLAEGAT
ncbi:MAG: hypothetical protein QOE65_2937 [Solirubrobacteraceae bacterium]|jgi:hypothetical protein|nr:hypothetical protein [Solirubrobacteraceae bacterium]